jgi:uncharacterized protein YlxW (UPF0749 family)
MTDDDKRREDALGQPVETPADDVPTDDAPTERLSVTAPPDRLDKLDALDKSDDGVDESDASEDEIQEEPRTQESQAPEPPAAAVPAKSSGQGLMGRMRGSRASGAGVLIAVLIGLLGFALVAQVKSNSSASTLSSDRPDDLVRILSDLDARKDRLNTEISSLQETQSELQSGAAGRQAALAEAAKRADDLGILAGTIAAEGPGLRITLSRGDDAIAAADVLDMVEELRGAGAEAMEIGDSQRGATVRIIASTYFVDTDDGIIADGQKLSGTLTLEVIGDPQTMQTALSIPGGAVDTIEQHGGNVTMASPGTVRVTALRPAATPKYAQPAS